MFPRQVITTCSHGKEEATTSTSRVKQIERPSLVDMGPNMCYIIHSATDLKIVPLTFVIKTSFIYSKGEEGMLVYVTMPMFSFPYFLLFLENSTLLKIESQVDGI